MPLGLRLSYLLAFGLKFKALFRHPTLGCVERVSHFGLGSLLMPVWTQDRLAAHIDIESTMINHPLEGVFLKLGASAIDLRPLLRLQLRLHLGSSPVHQGFTGLGLDDDKMTRIAFSGYFPGPFIKPCAIVKGLDFSGFKTLQTVVL